MLRLPPTTINLTVREVTDLNRKSHYRRYLFCNERKFAPSDATKSRTPCSIAALPFGMREIFSSKPSYFAHGERDFSANGTPSFSVDSVPQSHPGEELNHVKGDQESGTNDEDAEISCDENEERIYSRDTVPWDAIPTRRIQPLVLRPMPSPKKPYTGIRDEKLSSTSVGQTHYLPTGARPVQPVVAEVSVLVAQTREESRPRIESHNGFGSEAHEPSSPEPFQPGQADVTTTPVRGAAAAGRARVRSVTSPPRGSSMPLHERRRRGSSPLGLRHSILATAHRLLRSHSHLAGRSHTSPQLPRYEHDGPSSPEPDDRAPLRIPIYDDGLARSTQPQTPHNLPEARHRSRFVEFYSTPMRSRSSLLQQHRRRARPESPVGMQEPGFQGLYGGFENGDEGEFPSHGLGTH